MPHIGAAMERSLGGSRDMGGALRDLLARSVVAGTSKRDGTISSIGTSITDAKTAFSSWDNCMQATFCKWPVIAVIAIGGLIIFSIVWCIIRCACCGVSCCCECCYCLKCCGSCCGMCDSPKKKKYLDEPYIPPHHDNGYRSEAPMTAARAVPASNYDNSIAKPEPPQYAEFETSKKSGGDELPAMPSWEGANSKKVALEEEAVELEQLKRPEASSNVALMGPGSMSAPASPRFAPSARGESPYRQPSRNNTGDYMSAARGPTDPYAMNAVGPQQSYNNYNNNSYNQMSRDNVSQVYEQGYGNSPYDNQGYNSQGYDQGYGGNQPYGAAAAATTMSQGRQTPHQDYNNGGYRGSPMDQGYGQSRTPRPYEDYNRSMNGTPRSGTPGGGYGRPPPRQSPAPRNAPYASPDRTRSPAPQQGGYGYEQRSNTPNSYGRQFPPAPVRQYSTESSQPLNRPEPERQYTDASYHQSTPLHQMEPAQSVSPITNAGGFDFTSGFSRPQTASSPPPQQPIGGGTAYPGYRAYKPQN